MCNLNLIMWEYQTKQIKGFLKTKQNIWFIIFKSVKAVEANEELRNHSRPIELKRRDK